MNNMNTRTDLTLIYCPWKRSKRCTCASSFAVKRVLVSVGSVWANKFNAERSTVKAGSESQQSPCTVWLNPIAPKRQRILLCLDITPGCDANKRKLPGATLAGKHLNYKHHGGQDVQESA